MTASLSIVSANRTEALVEALSESLTRKEQVKALSLWQRDLVVVQGRGMAVWLNMELCRRHGVWANTEYVYPKNLISRAFASVLPDETSDNAYSQERLFWTIMAELPALLEQPDFAQLKGYLEGDADGRKRCQLVGKLATTFDEYLTYRPELLERWHRAERTGARSLRAKRGAGSPVQAPQLSLFGSATADTAQQWQQSLWRAVRNKLGDAHPAIREQNFAAVLAKGEPLPELPERISVFGLSSLPPLFLRILTALAERTRVELYLLSATTLSTPPTQNRLLTSLGAVGNEFQKTLLEACNERQLSVNASARFEAAAGTTLLAQLQREILSDTEAPELSLNAEDASLRFHSCHSPTREIEVLHDQLLAMIQEEGFQPHEIAVMAPNIDEYAPLIEAVFERSSNDPRFIPYRISDRRFQGDSEMFEGFARLLALVRARVSSVEVLDLLTLTTVRERFEIAADDLQVIRRWVVESGARWGIDGEHRGRFGVPAEHTGTWAFSLERLLLGYGVATLGNDTALGVLPYEQIEGKTGELLGRFAQFATTLFEQLATLSAARTVEAWQAALVTALNALFQQNQETSWQHQAILEALAEMRGHAELAKFGDELHLTVIADLLERHFDAQRSARGFLSGGVTFCAMTPMRSIPFRVVWLMGMNDGAFPRATFRPDFNLLDHSAEGRRAGDPDRRLDDRYLFLECLLAARDRLIVSFVGQSIRNNATLPPAVVVSELLDAVSERLPAARTTEGDAKGQPQRHPLLLAHPLQPFSPRYYGAKTVSGTVDPRLFSYEGRYLKGAKLLAGERRPATPFFDTLLTPHASNDVTLAELLEFFASPTHSLLRRRLGIDLREQENDVPEREPSVLDGLELYRVGAVLLSHCLAGVPRERSLQLLRKTGELPAGAGGEFEFERALASARPIAERARRLRSVLAHEHVAVDLTLAEASRLRGELSEVWARGLVSVQFARISAKHLLSSWIRHLVLCVTAPKGVAQNSFVVGRPDDGEGVTSFRFDAPPDPRKQLEGLLLLYRAGQSQPLQLFPEASLAFAHWRQKFEGDSFRALQRTSSAWTQELSRSAALRRIYGAEVPLLERGPEGVPDDGRLSFAEIAEAVFYPLLQHRTEESQ